MRNQLQNSNIVKLWVIVGATTLVGCTAEPDASHSLEASRALVNDRLPEAATQTGNLSLDGQSVTSDQAVAMALTRHPAIAADLARIKEADAQLAQAGLLPNPSLYGSLGFASDGGIGFAMASLTQSLSAIWQRPGKQAIANAQLQQMIVRVAFNMLETAGRVQRLHREVVYRQEALARLDEKSALLEKMTQSAADRFETGTGDAMERAGINVLAQRAKVEHQQARADLEDAKRRLLEAVGAAGGSTSFTAKARQASLNEIPDEAHALAMGLAQRLDIQAARWSVTAAGKELELAKAKTIPEVSVGVEYQKDDSMNTVGPAGTLELPIFDQGQARIAVAKAVQEREEASYQNLVQQATLQIRQAWVAFDSRKTQAQMQQENVVPASAVVLKFKQSSFETGDAGSLEVLRAQAELLDAQMAGLQASYEADLAGIALWQATGWGVDTFGVRLSQKEGRSQINQK